VLGIRSKIAYTKAKWGIEEHLSVLQEQGLPVPAQHPNPTVVIQNEQRLEPAA